MAKAMSPMRQVSLPFAEGEGSHAERWNDLVLALSRIGTKCDCEMATFVRWVFNATAGGVSGELKKSYTKLAERPLGLCCSREKARSTVETAARLGLIAVTPCRRYDGAQLDNAYTIDWNGVRALKLGRLADTTPDHGGGPAGHGGGLPWYQFKETKSLQSKNSVTGPEKAEPNPRMDSFEQRRPNALAERLVAANPILRESVGRKITPLPVGGLVAGIFAPLKETHITNIHKEGWIVKWFRQQLSGERATGDTEADLLLVLAAALYAKSLAASEIRKTRVAVFVSTITYRRWEKAMPFVEKARSLLDSGIKSLGRGWAGLSDEFAQSQPDTSAVEECAEVQG